MQTTIIKNSVLTALFAALIAVGSYISISIGPVSIVLANFFIFMAGLVLGFPWAIGSVILYLLIGLIGLPVFQNGSGGLGHLLGPTGGFLLGYPLAALLISLISTKKSLIRDIIAVLSGILIIYVTGLPWLKYKMEFTWAQTLAGGFFPFIPIDLVKGGAAIFIARNLTVNIGKNERTAA